MEAPLVTHMWEQSTGTRVFTCKGLVTNYAEGGYKTGGGACEVLSYEKEGGGGVLAMLKGGGGTTGFGVIFT